MARLIVLVALVLAAFGGTALTQEPQAKNVVGFYLCEGKNPDGSPYRGVVEIAAVGGTYLVHWMMSDSETLGVGILRDGTLSVSYYGGTPAIAVYKTDGKRLVGEWTMGGAEGVVFSETLTPMPKPEGATPRPDQRQRPRREPNERRPPTEGGVKL